MKDAHVYAGAAILGAMAGMRSMSAPAVISQFSEAGLIPEQGSTEGFLNHPAVSKVLKVLSAGEKMADKVPAMPARTDAAPLVARGLSGGVSGAAIFSRSKRPWWAGALIGAAAAIAASFAAYRLRKYVHEEFGIPDTVVGLVEDAVVAGCGYVVLFSLKSQAES